MMRARRLLLELMNRERIPDVSAMTETPRSSKSHSSVAVKPGLYHTTKTVYESPCTPLIDPHLTTLVSDRDIQNFVERSAVMTVERGSLREAGRRC